MSDFFQRAWSDIKQRRNLELYIILAVAITIFIADIFIKSDDLAVLSEIILASLAVLIYGLIDSRHVNERMEKQLQDIGESVQELQNSEVSARDFFLSEKPISNETFVSANTIFLLGYSLSRTVREFHFVLGQRLAAGANIRVMILDPENEPLLKMAALESTAATIDHWRDTVKVTKASVGSLAQYPNRKGKVEIGYLPFTPSFGIVLVDPNEPHGVCFVDIYHHKSTAPNATFKLSASDDGHWYEFFREQYEILWQSCRVEVFSEEK